MLTDAHDPDQFIIIYKPIDWDKMYYALAEQETQCGYCFDTKEAAIAFCRDWANDSNSRRILGQLKDNRFIIIFEKRLNTPDEYYTLYYASSIAALTFETRKEATRHWDKQNSGRLHEGFVVKVKGRGVQYL